MTAEKIARIGDPIQATCSIHGGVGGQWVTGSPTVFADGIAVVRLGDRGIASCGHGFSATGASSVGFANGIRIHRVGDELILDPGGTGVTVSGSPTVDLE